MLLTSLLTFIIEICERMEEFYIFSENGSMNKSSGWMKRDWPCLQFRFNQSLLPQAGCQFLSRGTDFRVYLLLDHQHTKKNKKNSLPYYLPITVLLGNWTLAVKFKVKIWKSRNIFFHFNISRWNRDKYFAFWQWKKLLWINAIEKCRQES